MGTDGTFGIKAIKGEAGLVMVQDEQSAKYEGMPRSAIATGVADFVLPPKEMPGQLIKYCKNRVSLSRISVTSSGSEYLSSEMQKIFAILRVRTGHDFSQYKQNTIRRRIERRMSLHQIDSASPAMSDSFRKATAKPIILFKEMLIGVTNFFRDPEAFETLGNDLLPKLLAGQARRLLRSAYGFPVAPVVKRPIHWQFC